MSALRSSSIVRIEDLKGVLGAEGAVVVFGGATGGNENGVGAAGLDGVGTVADGGLGVNRAGVGIVGAFGGNDALDGIGEVAFTGGGIIGFETGGNVGGRADERDGFDGVGVGVMEGTGEGDIDGIDEVSGGFGASGILGGGVELVGRGGCPAGGIGDGAEPDKGDELVLSSMTNRGWRWVVRC